MAWQATSWSDFQEAKTYNYLAFILISRSVHKKVRQDIPYG